jgi:hypothetical protein
MPHKTRRSEDYVSNPFGLGQHFRQRGSQQNLLDSLGGSDPRRPKGVRQPKAAKSGVATAQAHAFCARNFPLRRFVNSWFWVLSGLVRVKPKVKPVVKAAGQQLGGFRGRAVENRRDSNVFIQLS